jgi:hypothetical protein
MRDWLLEHPGGLKCDFDLFYRHLASTDKKVRRERRFQIACDCLIVLTGLQRSGKSSSK